jgi:hypothetical protein
MWEESVMEQNNKGLTRKVSVRLTQVEFKSLDASFRRTTKRKMSEYLRYVLLEKPLVFYTRDKSVDDFLAELSRLRAELGAIGKNFNQAVRKLNRMDKDPEIKTWAFLNEQSKMVIFKKMDEIIAITDKISQRWSQG